MIMMGKYILNKISTHYILAITIIYVIGVFGMMLSVLSGYDGVFLWISIMLTIPATIICLIILFFESYNIAVYITDDYEIFKRKEGEKEP